VIFKRIGEGRPYPDHGRSFKEWAEVAPREQWSDTEASLGKLKVSLPMPQVREWNSGEDYEPRAETDFRRHLDDWNRQIRETQTGRRAHLDKWNQLTPTYKSIVRIACDQANIWMTAKYDALNPLALKKLIEPPAANRKLAGTIKSGAGPPAAWRPAVPSRKA